MPAQTDIPPFSVTDGKVSNQAKINPSKLAPAKEGQVLIAGKDGKFAAGDLPKTVVTASGEVDELLPPNSVKIGPSAVDGTSNRTKEVGTSANAIPQRDSQGNLHATTADSATYATYLPYTGLTGTVPTWNQDTTGNSDTATALETARTIGGVSFDGTANINLPGVNAAGNQDTTGNALTATTAVTAQAGDSATDFFSSGTIADDRIASASTWNAKQDALTFGIANTNAVKIDHASVADNDFAKFTASGLEGRSYAEVKSDLSLNNVENTALSTWTGSSNITTLGTISGPLVVTGNLQVSGTIDTINETNTDLVDKTLTLAHGSASSSAANEAGITVAGADAKLQYLHSGTKWNFNKSVAATSFIGPLTGNVTGNVIGNLTGNSDTVTTNANLTGDITSSGNATSIAAGVIVNADINASAGIAYSKMEASSNAPTWNQNTTGTALNITGIAAITNGGTGATSASAARTALDVDQAGTDNSTNVTLSGTPDYITISGQTITRNQINLTTDVTGALPDANISSAATWNAMLPKAGGTLSGDISISKATPKIALTNTTTDPDKTWNVLANGTSFYVTEAGVADRLVIAAGGATTFSGDLTVGGSITRSSGTLNINGSSLALNNAGATKTYLLGTDGGSVQLRYNDITKFETSSGGVTISGNNSATPLKIKGGTLAVPSIQLNGGNNEDDNSSIYAKYSLALGCNSSTVISNRSILFKNGTTELARFDSSGRLGIGCDPSEKLCVNDSANDLQMRIGSLTAGRDARIRLQGKNAANSANRFADIGLDAENGILQFWTPKTSTPTSVAATISAAGTVTVNNNLTVAGSCTFAALSGTSATFSGNVNADNVITSGGVAANSTISTTGNITNSGVTLYANGAIAAGSLATTGPIEATGLDVSGTIQVTPTASEKGITIGDASKGEVPLIFKGVSGSHSIGQNGASFFISENNAGNLDNNPRLVIDTNGKVGLGGITVPDEMLHVSGNIKATGIYAASSDDRTKFRPWGSSSHYGMGMHSSFSYGGLNDYALTFQMNNDADRGFWWGHSGHSASQGAMSLTTGGKLNVAHSVRVGYGESDTVTPGAANNALDLNGALTVSLTGLGQDTVTEIARFKGSSATTNTDLIISSAVSGSTVANRYIDLSVFDHAPAARSLSLQKAGGNVGIGSTSAPHKLSIFGTGAGNATVQIEGEGGADPTINFLVNNTTHWAVGADDSDSDSFKISQHSALGTNDRLTLTSAGVLHFGGTSTSFIYNDSSVLRLAGDAGVKIQTYSGGWQDRIVVADNGQVGIGGVTAPAQTLHIAANGSGSTAVDNHGYGLRVQDTNSAHGAIDILQNGDTATFVSRSNVQGGYEFKSYASVGTATYVRLKIASNGDISFLDGAGSATFLWSRANGRLVLSKSDYQLQIQNGANIWFNKVNSSGSFAIHRNGVGDILSMGTGGTDINAHTHFRPYNNNQYTCGTNANRWSNVYSVAGNFSGSVAIAQGQLLYLDGGSNTYMYSDTADSIAIATGGSVRMTLNNSGVGINAAPDGGLKIKSTGDGVNVLNLVDSAGDAMFNIRQSSNDCLIRAYKDGGSQKVQIHTDGSSWFTGGQVGIGTSAPFTEGLEVAFPSADTSFNLNDQSDSILVLRNSDSGSTNTGRFCAIQMKINSSSAAAEGTIRTEFAGDGDADLIFSTTKGGTGYDRMTLDEDGYLTIGAITLPKTDGSANQVLKTNGSGTLSWTDQSGGGGSGVTGSGTTHYVPKFTASGAIGNSTIQQASSGNFTGFGLSPSYGVHVLGIIAAQDAVATARLIATGAGGTMIDLKSDGGIFKIRNASAGNELYHLKTGNSGYHKWYIADSLKMTLHASGTLAVTGSITSDGKSVPKKYSSYIAVNTATTDYYTLQHNLGTDMIIVQARNGFDSNSASSLQNRFTQSGNNGKSFDLGSESVEFVCIPCDSNGTKSNNHVSFDFGGLGSFNGYIYVTVIG